MALTDYSIDTSGSPDDMKRRAALAQALMQQGSDTSPVGGGGMGVFARALQGAVGGYQSGQISREDKAARSTAAQQLADALGGTLPSQTSAVPAVNSPMGSLSKPAPMADTTGKIYGPNDPSPLDPPVGDDLDKTARTVVAEAGNQGPLGMQAVSSVIRNRAVDGGYGGDTATGVVTSPNQFEPWNTSAGRAKMAAIDPNSPEYKAAVASIDKAYFGDDPTEGKTMFYAPKTQAALGRAAPSWAKGEGQTIGDHVFYDDESPAAAAKPVQLAGPVPTPDTAPAVPAQGATPNGIKYDTAKLMAVLNNPYATPAQQQIAQTLLKSQLEPKEVYTQETDKDGNVWNVNKQTGQRTVALKATDKNDPNTPKVLGKGGELYTTDAQGNVKVIHRNQDEIKPMDDDAAELLADRVRAGDTKALVGLGRGAQGAENLAKINSIIARKAASGEPISDAAMGILRNAAEQQGLVSSFRTLGTKWTHFGTAEKAAEESFPLAQAASDAVPRTQWKTLTTLIQKGQTEINDPNLKRFLIATDTAAKDYARTINPQGVLRESDIEYARKILSTADSPEAYKAALGQLGLEVQVMHRALTRQKGELKGQPDPGVKPAAPVAAVPTPAAGPEEGAIAHNPTTGETLVRRNGKWVPES